MNQVKITAFEAENVKRVKAVSLTPAESGLTIIGGRNAQGKTSVLDAIAWALGGERFKPTNAQREGSVLPPHLRVELSNGIIVERKGKNSELSVSDPTGKRAGQTLLNSFVEGLALNLPKFMAGNDMEKANTLLRIIGLEGELAELDRKERTLYNDRLAVGRIADQKEKHARELPYHEDAPDEPVSVSELIAQQQEILARNGENQRKRQEVERIRIKAQRVDEELNALYVQRDMIEQRINEKEQEQTAVFCDLQTATISAERLQDESTADLEENIRSIEQVNIKVRENQERERAVDEAEALRGEYNEYSNQLEKLRKEKLALLEGADMPLEGLSVDEGKLTYKDKAWDCMSGAEQLRVATAIVRKLNPNCGFVLLDKLEQLDKDTLQEFGAWLEQEGLQAIATRVSTGEECTLLIEDGRVSEPIATATVKWKAGEF